MLYINSCIILSLSIFLISIAGMIIVNKNIIYNIIMIECIFVSAAINFVGFGEHFYDISGHVFVIFILGIAAAKTAIGLSIAISYYKINNSLVLDKIENEELGE